eukprot:g13254.t1
MATDLATSMTIDSSEAQQSPPRSVRFAAGREEGPHTDSVGPKPKLKSLNTGGHHHIDSSGIDLTACSPSLGSRQLDITLDSPKVARNSTQIYHKQIDHPALAQAPDGGDDTSEDEEENIGTLGEIRTPGPHGSFAIPERVGMFDDRLSPMKGKVSFTFKEMERKHHTPRHSKYHPEFNWDAMDEGEEGTEGAEGPAKPAEGNGQAKAPEKGERKKALKQQPRRRDSLEIVRADLKRQELTDKHVEFGQPCRRFLSIDPDATEIRWESTFEAESRRKKLGFLARKARVRQLGDITGVIYSSLVEFANRKSRFYQYNREEKPPWLAITVLFDQETLDLVFDNEQTVDIWFFGLQNLAPMSKFYLPRGPQFIFRAQLKLEMRARQQEKHPFDVLLELYAKAKGDAAQEQVELARRAADSEVLLQGMLKKKSPKEILGKHPWQTRYFVLLRHKKLLESKLIYSKDKEWEKSMIGQLHIAVIRRANKLDGKKGRFNVEMKAGEASPDGGFRNFELMAKDDDQAEEWAIAINDLVDKVNARTPVANGKFWKTRDDTSGPVVGMLVSQSTLTSASTSSLKNSEAMQAVASQSAAASSASSSSSSSSTTSLSVRADLDTNEAVQIKTSPRRVHFGDDDSDRSASPASPASPPASSSPAASSISPSRTTAGSKSPPDKDSNPPKT